MKPKGIIASLLLVFFAGIASYAQDSTATDDCAKWRSLYYQYLKQKMYRDAGNFWTKAIESCGEEGLDSKFYTNGRYIYSKLLKAEEDEAKKVGLNDTINMIYESRMKLENDPQWTADYASKLVSDKSTAYGKMDTLFAQSIHQLKDKAKSTHIKQYFKHLIINNFNNAPAEEKEAARAIVIEEYIVLSDYVGTALKAAKEAGKEKEIKRQESAASFLDKYFLKIAKDCAVLTPVLDTKFETIPEGEDGLTEINKFVALMEKQKCTDTDTYARYVEESVKRNPTAAGYFGLGNVMLSKDKTSEAITAFEKAVELEADGENKDKYLLNLANAQYKSRSYKSAFRTAKQVSGDFKGDALMICANSIAATANGCGESTFERKANYWLANDYVNRAIAAGKKGVSSSKFLSNAPDSNDAFNEGISSGSSISLSCWGESTTVRF